MKKSQLIIDQYFRWPQYCFGQKSFIILVQDLLSEKKAVYYFWNSSNVPFLLYARSLPGYDKEFA